MLPRADALCCLSDLGSVNTPRCVVADQRKEMTVGQKGTDSEPGDCAGRSIVEMMEDVLDGLVMWLQTADKETTPVDEMENMKGRAQGVADCIALVRSPYYPNVDAVKHAAVLRYRYRVEQDDKKALDRVAAAAQA